MGSKSEVRLKPSDSVERRELSYFCSITETIAFVINLVRDFVIKVD
jgi:hypothetical protein